uniref:F-box domain-containing protein n=1 Tax=Aegilops tauschii TaxID=37682 RepID=R7W567_AEGTA
MAAATSADVQMPLATPDLPPAEGKEKGRTAMVGADWSSLPYDLIHRIADSFLTTNDVTCYVDLRVVCHHWRSAIDDPKTDASDSRFHPRRWIILDEVFESDTRRLLVNASTGRFLHKELPLLRNYYVIATTHCGFFVLADRSPPHAAHLFNPLTGAMIRFMAPVPPEGEVAAAIWPSSCAGGNTAKTEADLEDKKHRLGRRRRLADPAPALRSRRTINNYAIFIGHQRCLAVCADKFPSVEANCVYYTKHRGSSARCRYNLKDDKREVS